MVLLVGLGLDLIAVSIVLYCMRAAAKKGFLRTVVQMVAYVVVLLTASFFSRAAAPVIYDRVVEPMLLESVYPGREDAPENASFIMMAPRGSLSAAGPAVFGLGDLLPEGVGPEELLEELADGTIRPLAISAISMLGFVLLFALLSMAANILLSALGVINHLPVIGTFNAILGGAVGVLQGLLLVMVLCILLKGLLHLYPDGWWVLNRDALEHTYLCRYLLNLDLLGRLFA